jgi:hypothetical protein
MTSSYNVSKKTVVETNEWLTHGGMSWIKPRARAHKNQHAVLNSEQEAPNEQI